MTLRGQSNAEGTQEKKCSSCGMTKPIEDFPRNRRVKDGPHSYCKPCHNRRGREFISKNHGSTRHYHLRQRYGIGIHEVHSLVDAQSGKCAICKDRAARQVDHDHQSGQVRGILCLHCNAAMGAFKDDPNLIASAIKYLERGTGG